MSYYPERDSLIRDKVKVLLELPNYGTKKELESSTCIDTSDLATKRYFIVLKTQVDMFNINELANVLTGLNNFRTNVNDLDVPKDFKR